MAEVSTLVLKVDLECSCSYYKIRKILCKFHEIRDQIFDEKNNTVTIVGPFCPNKMAKKLSCKAGKLIISIEEKKEPEKPKHNTPSKENPKPNNSNREIPGDKTLKAPEPDQPVLGYPVAPPVYPVPLYPVPAYPFGVCCRPCYGRRPCYQGCGRSTSCDGGCGRPPCDCGCGRPPPCNGGCGRPPCDGGCGSPPPCDGGRGRPPCDDRCGSPPPCCDDCERKENVNRYDYLREENPCKTM